VQFAQLVDTFFGLIFRFILVHFVMRGIILYQCISGNFYKDMQNLACNENLFIWHLQCPEQDKWDSVFSKT